MVVIFVKKVQYIQTSLVLVECLFGKKKRKTSTLFSNEAIIALSAEWLSTNQTVAMLLECLKFISWWKREPIGIADLALGPAESRFTPNTRYNSNFCFRLLIEKQLLVLLRLWEIESEWSQLKYVFFPLLINSSSFFPAANVSRIWASSSQ